MERCFRVCSQPCDMLLLCFNVSFVFVKSSKTFRTNVLRLLTYPLRINTSFDRVGEASDEQSDQLSRNIQKIHMLHTKVELLENYISNNIIGTREQLEEIMNILGRCVEYDSLSTNIGAVSSNSVASTASGAVSTYGRPSVSFAANGNDVQVFPLEMNGLDVLRALFAPFPSSSFLEPVPNPMEITTLEKIPSINFSSFVKARKEKGKDHNTECNICMSEYSPDDLVRVFPCCELAQHSTCLEQWFKEHDMCIVCRKKTSDVFANASSSQGAPNPRSTQS